MAVISMDLGGTRIKVGIIDAKGKMLAVTKIDAVAHAAIESNLQQINPSIHALIKQVGLTRDEIDGIGISVPSIVDTDANKVVSQYVKYGDANTFDFQKWAATEWGLPLYLENDARAALIGEWRYGAGKGYNDIVLLTLGTGIGSAVLYNGALLKGKHFIAGSLGGHTVINFDGDKCNCGGIGCAETVASTWALPHIIKQHVLFDKSSLQHIDRPEFFHLFEEAAKGDALASEVLQQCLKAWGMVAVNMVHNFDPEVIIISGGIMKSASQILPYIQNAVDKYTWLSKGTVQILAAEAIEYAGLLGMGFIVHQLTRPIEENA